MASYLTMDTGGTKSVAVLFNENLDLLAQGTAGGTNLSQTTRTEARQNMETCLRQALAPLLTASSGRKPYLDGFYFCIVGSEEDLKEILYSLADVGDYHPFTEFHAGLLASGIRKSGFLAISGTGSDCFYLTEKKNEHYEIGGMGPIFGDFGSGVWIGWNALQAVAKDLEHWGRPTLMTQKVMQAWHCEKPSDMIPVVYQSPAPFRVAGSVTRIAAQAACEGDECALELFRQAGHLMAEQLNTLIRNLPGIRVPAEDRYVYACGGAWKAHSLMFDTFRQEVLEENPDYEVHRACFEHVMAGPVYFMMEKGCSREEIIMTLSEKFPGYTLAGKEK